MLAETSAGGLVVRQPDARPEVALIARLTRRGQLEWVIPKGHVEAGESLEQAAVREVLEETGIDSCVRAALGSIDYWFVDSGRRIHKTVHHYLLDATGGSLSDLDPEVTEVAWVGLADASERLAYADERGLIEVAARLLADPR